MTWCSQVFVYLSAVSCVSEGVSSILRGHPHSNVFLSQSLAKPANPINPANFRARIDGFHSQSPINPTDLGNVDAELKAMKARQFSDVNVLIDKGKDFKATGTACDADIFLQGWRRPFGFGSRALVAMNEVQLAAVFGLSITVCGGDFVTETWSNHFKNLAGITICAAEMCSHEENMVSDAAVLGMRLSEDLSLVDADSLINMKHIIFRRMYTYNDETMAAVNTILEAVPVDVQKPYVGVHIRRGDKVEEAEPTPMSSYATAVIEQMDILGTRTVFVASDDPSAGSMLADELAATGHSDVQVLQQHQDETLIDNYGVRDYSDDDSTMEMLADIEGLRLATVFIGTQSSSLGRMILYLRGELSSSISLDGGWFDSFPL